MRSAARWVARYSLLGEHAAGWLVLAAGGGAAQPPLRSRWLRAGGTVLAAHGASVVAKRVVRRQRPPVAGRTAAVSTHSNWSFPSSHATASGAALVAFRGLLPAPVLVPAALTLAGSRLVLRVHYPADVVGGLLFGAALAGCAGRRRG